MGLKEAKEKFIIEVATKLFFSRSISLVTIKDIADEAGVGEMTIYRYFKKKQFLVLAVAMKLQEEISQFFDLSKGQTGLEKISIFYHCYLDVFTKSPNHYQFIKEFDSYMLEFANEDYLKQYENALSQFKTSYLEAYKLGLEDKSIREIDNIDMFYFTSTHALLEVCKKLSYGNELLEQDKRIVKNQEIETLINVFISYLKNS